MKKITRKNKKSYCYTTKLSELCVHKIYVHKLKSFFAATPNCRPLIDDVVDFQETAKGSRKYAALPVRWNHDTIRH